MIKKIFYYFLLFTIYCLLPKQILAADFTVTCAQEGPCVMVPDGIALFSESNWLPGDTITRTITFINQDPTYNCPLIMDITCSNQKISLFATKLFTNIRDRNTGVYLYGETGETLDDLYNIGTVSLNDIPALGTKYFDWTVTFDPNTGNTYQSAKTIFDFELVFTCGKPDGGNGDGDGNGTTTNGGTDGDGGTGGGDTVTATTTWTGFPFTSGTGGYLAYTPLEEEGDVEGIEIEEKEPEISAPEVKGEKTCAWWHYLWWVPLVVQGLLTYLYYHWLKDKKVTAWWSMPLILAALSQIIHEVLGCECVDSKWCPWYWLFNLIIFSALTLYYLNRRKKQSSDLTEE